MPEDCASNRKPALVQIPTGALIFRPMSSNSRDAPRPENVSSPTTFPFFSFRTLVRETAFFALIPISAALIFILATACAFFCFAPSLTGSAAFLRICLFVSLSKLCRLPAESCEMSIKRPRLSLLRLVDFPLDSVRLFVSESFFGERLGSFLALPRDDGEGRRDAEADRRVLAVFSIPAVRALDEPTKRNESVEDFVARFRFAGSVRLLVFIDIGHVDFPFLGAAPLFLGAAPFRD
jgi:hypothetical protein